MTKLRRDDSGRGPEARMVVHEDEHTIVREILSRALGDDDSFAKVVSGDRSESRRAEDRVVLAGFLRRLDRQFDRRESRREESDVAANGRGKSAAKNGREPSAHSANS